MKSCLRRMGSMQTFTIRNLRMSWRNIQQFYLRRKRFLKTGVSFWGNNYVKKNFMSFHQILPEIFGMQPGVFHGMIVAIFSKERY